MMDVQALRKTMYMMYVLAIFFPRTVVRYVSLEKNTIFGVIHPRFVYLIIDNI